MRASAFEFPAEPAALSRASALESPAEPAALSRVSAFESPAEPAALSRASAFEFPAEPAAFVRASAFESPAEPAALSRASAFEFPAEPAASAQVSRKFLPRFQYSILPLYRCLAQTAGAVCRNCLHYRRVARFPADPRRIRPRASLFRPAYSSHRHICRKQGQIP